MPEVAAVASATDVVRSDVEAPPAVAPDEDSAASARKRVKLVQLRVVVLEANVRILNFEQKLEESNRGSCVFYFDPADRPVPASESMRQGLTKDDFDRIEHEIDDARADITDPADRAAFDRDVTDRFRRARAQFEEATSR